MAAIEGHLLLRLCDGITMSSREARGYWLLWAARKNAQPRHVRLPEPDGAAPCRRQKAWHHYSLLAVEISAAVPVPPSCPSEP
jgi:hypothetical protein